MIKLRNSILKSASITSVLLQGLRLLQFDTNSILKKANLAGPQNEIDSNYWLGPELWDLDGKFIIDSKFAFDKNLISFKRLHSWPWAATSGSDSSFHGEFYLNWGASRPEFIVNDRYTTNVSITNSGVVNGEIVLLTNQTNVQENGVWISDGSSLIRHPSWLADHNYNRSELVVRVESGGSGANTTWETWPIFIDGYLCEIIVTSDVLTVGSNLTKSKYVRMGKTSTTRLFYAPLITALETTIVALVIPISNLISKIDLLKNSTSNDQTVERAQAVLLDINTLILKISDYSTALDNIILFYQLLPTSKSIEEDILQIESHSGWIESPYHPSLIMESKKLVQKLYNPNYSPNTGGGVSGRLSSTGLADVVQAIADGNAMNFYKQRVGMIMLERNGEDYIREIERELHVRGEGPSVQSNIEAGINITESFVSDKIKTLDDPIADDDLSVPPPGKL